MVIGLDNEKVENVGTDVGVKVLDGRREEGERGNDEGYGVVKGLGMGSLLTASRVKYFV